MKSGVAFMLSGFLEVAAMKTVQHSAPASRVSDCQGVHTFSGFRWLDVSLGFWSQMLSAYIVEMLPKLELSLT